MARRRGPSREERERAAHLERVCAGFDTTITAGAARRLAWLLDPRSDPARDGDIGG